MILHYSFAFRSALYFFHKLSVKDHHSILGLTIWLSHTSGLKCSLAFFPGFWLRQNDFLLILLPLQHSFILLSFKCFEGGIFLLVLGWGKHSLALLADSHDSLTQLDKHRGHVDVHMKLVVASKTNVNGRDLDGLAPLAQMVELPSPTNLPGLMAVYTARELWTSVVLGSAARWVWSLLTRHLLQW